MKSLALFFLCCPSLLAANSELVVDLAVAQATQRIAPATYDTIRLVGTLPERDYTVDTKVETHAIPGIDLKQKEQDVADAYKKLLGAPGPPAPVQECIDLKTALDGL